MRKDDPRAACSDADFVRLFEQLGPAKLADKFGISKRAVYSRRETLEGRYCRQITAPPERSNKATRCNIQHSARIHFDVLNGTVLVGSDAHIWPGPLTTAMRAFIKFAGELKPRVLCLNGDVLDFPQVSRHPHSWEEWPSVADEIEAARKVLVKIEDAVPRNCKLSWCLGNHDSRLETRIATVAPELAKLKGVHLKDHFGDRWQPCWSSWINGEVVIKHRYKGGVHATHNNAVQSGKHIVTGHLHSAKVTPWTDYNGTRYGVDTGCLADPNAEAFAYTEDNPKNWVSAFAVLTFVNGQLLPPELVTVWGKDEVAFRGEIIKV